MSNFSYKDEWTIGFPLKSLVYLFNKYYHLILFTQRHAIFKILCSAHDLPTQTLNIAPNKNIN